MNNKKLVIIPLLILLYFFVHYITDLYHFLEPSGVFIKIILYVLVTVILFFGGYKLFNNKERFTLAFSTALFLFLFYGSIMDTAKELSILKTDPEISTPVIVTIVLVITVLIYLSFRLKQNTVNRLLRGWLIYCTLVLIYDVALFIISEKEEKKYVSVNKIPGDFSTTNKPSVFYLLFDMYPSDSVFKKHLGYDNSSFSSFLKENGFFVTGNSEALYDKTIYSIGSTLNLQALPYFNNSSVREYKKKLIAVKNLDQARLIQIFEKSGYDFRNYSLFKIRGHPSPLQFNLNDFVKNALTSATCYNTLMEFIEPDFIMVSKNIDISFIKPAWSDMIKNDIPVLNSGLAQLLNNYPARPGFQYFHFMFPHSPVLYDSNGVENHVRDMYSYNGYDRTIKNFTAYTTWANKEIKKMIHAIFEKAGRNVVIVIQGDHGYRPFSGRHPGEVRFGIMNAVYLPGNNYKGFHDSMTPVETFRQVLANQFQYTINE